MVAFMATNLKFMRVVTVENVNIKKTHKYTNKVYMKDQDTGRLYLFYAYTDKPRELTFTRKWLYEIKGYVNVNGSYFFLVVDKMYTIDRTPSWSTQDQRYIEKYNNDTSVLTKEQKDIIDNAIQDT